MALRTGADIPSLAAATDWIGGAVETTSLVGSPTLIHFWSVSCHVCKTNLPRVQEWKEKYGPQGLKFVAVHMPRELVETNLDLVEEAVETYSLTEPCAVDNDHALAEAFGNTETWVPYYFLFDADGKLKGRGAGYAAADTLGSTLTRYFA